GSWSLTDSRISGSFTAAVAGANGATSGTIDVLLPVGNGYTVDPASVTGNEISVSGGFTLHAGAPTATPGVANSFRYTVDGTISATNNTAGVTLNPSAWSFLAKAPTVDPSSVPGVTEDG